jgi:hypothetical protein
VASGAARADFAARAAALPDAWEARGRFDPLVPVRPLLTAARHDTADVVLAPLAGARAVTQIIDGALDGLCRVCVKVDADGDREGRDLVLAVSDAASPERPLAEVRRRVRAPVRSRWVAFDFDPLPAAAEARRIVHLTSPGGAAGAHVLPHVARNGTLSFEAFALRAR